mgnify:FL=1
MAHLHEKIHIQRIRQFIDRLSRDIVREQIPFEAEFA